MQTRPLCAVSREERETLVAHYCPVLHNKPLDAMATFHRCTVLAVGFIAFTLASVRIEAMAADVYAECAESNDTFARGFTQPALLDGLVHTVNVPRILDSDISRLADVTFAGTQRGKTQIKTSETSRVLTLFTCAALVFLWLLRWLDLSPESHGDGIDGIRREFMIAAYMALALVSLLLLSGVTDFPTQPATKRACVHMALVPYDKLAFDAITAADHGSGNWSLCASLQSTSAVIESRSELLPVSPGSFVPMHSVRLSLTPSKTSCWRLPPAVATITCIVTTLLLVFIGACVVGKIMPMPPTCPVRRTSRDPRDN